MPHYLVEFRLDRAGPEQVSALAAALTTATLRAGDSGARIAFMHGSYVPVRSRCYCLFEADAPSTVRRVSATAQLPLVEITEAHHIAGRAAPAPAGTP